MDELAEFELKKAHVVPRLTNRTFRFDRRYQDGYFAANYFLKTRKIVAESDLKDCIVEEQFFQRKDDVMLCGIDEVIALLFEFASHPQDLKVYALNDGDMISNGEPVLKIYGRYTDFGFLESAIDGILTRRTAVATNSYRVVKAANGKKILNMGDRQDDPLNQPGDGYASYVGGIRAFSTDANGEWIGLKGKGTMPHALIEMCNGDIVKACELYHKTFPNEKVTALVDYHNDVCADALKAARALGDVLGAVRVDTSKALIDHCFDHVDTSSFDPHGVCVEQIVALRKALDSEGFSQVQIVVSSGFTAEKIAEFEKRHAPVDVYGVGTSLLQINVGFTGDLVRVNGKEEAKEGRHDVPSDRLTEVRYIPQ